MLRSSASVVSIHSLNSRGSRRTNGRDGKPRRFNLNEAIESAFELIVGEYGTKANLEIPIGFYEMYNSGLMRNFLASAIFYFYAYIRVLRLAHVHREKVASGAQSGLRREQRIDFAAQPDLREARREQKDRLERMSRAYARLLLSCSNFEHTHEDVLLFECIYQFVFLVLKTGVDPAPFEAKDLWVRVQGELCYVFRGPNFDIESKRFLKLELERKAREIERLKREDAAGTAPPSSSGQSGAAAATSSGSAAAALESARSRPSIAGSNSRAWQRGSKMAASGRSSLSHTLSHSSGSHAGGADPNRPEAKLPLPDNIYLNIASFDMMRPEGAPQGPKRGSSPRKSGHALRSPELALLGQDSLALRAREQTKAFSVHKAIHARSPILSMILPDPLERTRRNAQAALARSSVRGKGPRRRTSRSEGSSASPEVPELQSETDKLMAALQARR